MEHVNDPNPKDETTRPQANTGGDGNEEKCDDEDRTNGNGIELSVGAGGIENFHSRESSVTVNPVCALDSKGTTATSTNNRASMDVTQLSAWLRNVIGVNESALAACAAENIDGAVMDEIIRDRDRVTLVELGIKNRLTQSKLFAKWCREEDKSAYGGTDTTPAITAEQKNDQDDTDIANSTATDEA